MSDKKIKKVQVSESKLVDLISNIVEQTIAERIEKGELAKVEAPKKTKKVTVTESQYKELVKAGKVISAVKKKR